MGQKINPNIFRLIIKKKNTALWIENLKNYAKYIKEDFLINSFFNNIKELEINNIIIKRNIEKKILKIKLYILYPQILNKIKINFIYKNLKQFYKKKNQQKIIISTIQIKNPFLKTNLLINTIIKQINDRLTFQRIIQILIIKLKSIKLLGIKIQISGRLNGIEKASTEWYKQGQIPLQTLTANIEYTKKITKTKYGIIGIKIWLFKN